MLKVKRSPARVTWGVWFNDQVLYTSTKKGEAVKEAKRLAREFRMSYEVA